MSATNDDSQTSNQLNMRLKYPQQSKPCQVLPDNRLDKDVQMIANSYNIALFMFVSSKYYVKANHIYPREKIFLSFKICHIIFTNTWCIYRMFTINVTNVSMKPYEDEYMQIFSVVFYATYFICFTFVFFHDVVHQNNFIVLILKIQKIHKYIDCSKKIKSYVMLTYFGVIFTICIDSLIIIAFYVFFDNLYWFDITITCYCDFMILSFNINYVISMRILDLLKLFLEEWTKEVLKNVGTKDDEQCIKLLEMYQNIIEAYNLHSTIFEKLILTHILVSVSQSLVIVYAGINSFTVSKFYTFDLFFWFFKNSSLAVMHSVCCERFYIRVEEAQSACIQLVNNRNYSHSQQHLCRNVLATNRTFSRMSACGLFSVGATLAISLLATVTQYSIIILQFNLL